MAHESADPDAATGGTEKSGTEQASASPGEESAAPHRRRLLRPLFHRWFFSTDRRYQMFQTIFGGTIANLVAAGIIAGIAVASGGLRISFNWSWHFFWETTPITAAIGFILGIVAAPVLHSGSEEERLEWPAAIAVGLYLAVGTTFIWALIVTFFDALNFSIVHVKTK